MYLHFQIDYKQLLNPILMLFLAGLVELCLKHSHLQAECSQWLNVVGVKHSGMYL